MASSGTSLADVSVNIPSVAEIWAVLSLGAGYNSMLVVLGASLLGIAAGIIGSFSLLRKRALMGDALAHCALPGLAVSFIFAYLWDFEGRNLYLLLFGAAVSGLIGVFVVHLFSRYTRITEEAAIGAVLSVFFGAGIVLLSVIQTLDSASAGGLSHFIYGQTAAMGLADAYMLLVLASVVSRSCRWFKKRVHSCEL